MLTSKFSPRHRGFNLIELMVASAAGLIIMTAAFTFIIATIESSGATVRSTRLSQELRALTEVIARDIRRARAVTDPLNDIGTGCSNTDVSTTNDCGGVAAIYAMNATAGSSCILYGYRDGATTDDFRVIRLSGTNVVLATGSATQTCNAAGTALNSPLVEITAFNVSGIANGVAAATTPTQVDIEITGRLVGDSSGVTQTYRTTVFVRSGNAG